MHNNLVARNTVEGTIKWFVLLIFVLFIVILHAASIDAQDWFGHQSGSIIDLWSIQHLFSGVLMGFACRLLLRYKQTKPKLIDWLWLMTFYIFFWEGLEWWSETGGRGIDTARWYIGLEHWSDRFVLDPIMALIGGAFYKKAKKAASRRLFGLALGFTVLWGIANQCAPTCMHVQEKIFVLLF